MKEDNDDFENRDDYQERVKLTVNRYEEMVRNQDRYFFDVEALVRILDFYAEKGEYIKALEVVKYSFSLHPNSVDLMMKQAHLFALTGQDQRALETLDKVEQISPYDIDLHLVRGNIFNTLGNYEEALRCFSKALAVAENRDEVYFSIAITYHNMQDFTRAIENFKKALQINSGYELAMEELTACFSMNGQLDEGLAYYKELIDRDPYSYAAWYNLGDIHCRLGQYEASLHAFDYCLLIRDDFAPAYLDQAHVLAMLGHFEQAIQKYQQTFEYFNPDGITYFNIAECYEKLEKMDDARTFYKKAVRLLPEMAQAWYGIALTLEFEERWYEAIHYVKKALEKDPGNPEYLLLLGDCEFNLNNLNEAFECYRQVTVDEPTFIDGWVSLSDFYIETGNPQEAVNVMNTGLFYNPGNAELLYHQVVNFYCTGELEDSYVYLQQAMEADASQVSLIFELLPAIRNDQHIINIIRNNSSHL